MWGGRGEAAVRIDGSGYYLTGCLTRQTAEEEEEEALSHASLS